MAYFTPPLRKNQDASDWEIPREDIDPAERRKNANGNKLARYFVAPHQAVNVWVLEDGTITEAQPFGPAYDARQAEYLGSHTYWVSEAEAAALVAAGYTVDP